MDSFLSTIENPHMKDSKPSQSVAVLQMVDTLTAGGMERVAVNLANLIPRQRYRSYLCTTRCDGPLSRLINEDVGRLQLNRRRRFEWKALQQLVEFIRTNDIEILHAHGMSLWTAFLASFFPPYPSVFWHDHYGEYAMQERPAWLYRILIQRVAGVLAVNDPLVEWSRCRLHVPRNRVWYIPNFVSMGEVSGPLPKLPGTSGARIVCVANLRPQKDHLMLIRAMKEVVATVPSAHALLVGNHKDVACVSRIKQEIQRFELDDHISLLGQRQDIPAILSQCDIGVLSSASEGLPLSLLEYGLGGLPAVVTRVGQSPEVVADSECGILVSPGSSEEMAQALLSLLASPQRRAELARGLKRRVQESYSVDGAIAKIGRAYETVLEAKANT